MESLAYIAPWVFGSVLVGVIVGHLLGRSRARNDEHELAERERQATLRVLVELLQAVEQMSGNVECHNSEIRQTAYHVDAMSVPTEMEAVKQTLLGHMRTLLQSNQALQEDLLCTRYRMEEQAQEIDHARREARTDALTSVANRKAFDEKLHLLLADWKRESKPFVLLMVDVDHLKRVNDSHGHQAGDQALERIGHWLREWVREGDFVGRYGGDEFAILLPATDRDTALQLAEAVRQLAAERASRVTYRGEQVALSLSIGLSAVAPNDTEESIIRRADQALYKAKLRGRNQVQCDDPPAPPEAAEPDLLTVAG